MIPHKNEILHMERRYWDAMKNNDVEAAVALKKFPCVISGPQGARRVTEEQYRELMIKEAVTARMFASKSKPT